MTRLPCLLAALLLLGPLPAAGRDGRSQSPVAIASDMALRADLPALMFLYATDARLTLADTGAPAEEATIRADICPVCGLVHGAAGDLASALTVDGVRFDLLQFHVHAPAEHQIDGQRGALELHLVHRADDGRLAVVARIYTLGAADPALQPYFDALDDAARAPATAHDFDLSAVLPDDLTSFRYTGSLTAPSDTNPEPPFREPVAWTVLADRGTVSQAQLDLFLALFAEGNARPVQPLNGRTVLTDLPPGAP